MSRIVVIEDSKLMRTMLCRVLEHAGHDVEVWEEVTAAEIPERISAVDPDLIITDYQMPGCNGLTVARMARRVRPELPVIVVTATHDPALTTALERVDVTHVLHKPLRGEELVQAVHKALNQS